MTTPEDTEQHRRECEAREILKRFKTAAERRAWLHGVGRVRGIEAQRYLEAEVRRQWRLQKENNAS